MKGNRKSSVTGKELCILYSYSVETVEVFSRKNIKTDGLKVAATTVTLQSVHSVAALLAAPPGTNDPF